MSQRRLRDEVVQNFDEDTVVFLSISIETNAEASRLAQYADDENFGWQFAVATPEMVQQLTAQFGRTVTVPPRQPHFILRPDGSTTDLLLGNPPANQTIELIQTEGGL